MPQIFNHEFSNLKSQKLKSQITRVGGMSRRLENPPPFAEGLRGVLNGVLNKLHNSACTLRREFIRSMNPPPPPAGSPHDADPAHPSACYCFLLAFFRFDFRSHFSLILGSIRDPKIIQNRIWDHKNAFQEFFLRFLVRAGVFCVCRLIWRQKTMKN